MAAERFRAMGSAAHVIVHGDPALVRLARSEIRRLEGVWSRFVPTSEVSRANDRAGTWVEVGPETLELVQRSIVAASLTGGRFDPTVLGAVVRAGYDRTYDQIPHRREGSPTLASTLQLGVDALHVDAERRAIRVDPGVGFDPGGIGKGLAADLVAARIDTEGAAGVLVNLGGDLRAIGYGPNGEDWTVDLDPAATGRPLATVSIAEGAVATSTTLRRTWTLAGTSRHHLIDPATGLPAAGPVVAATVLAARGWQAEVAAKGALIAAVTDGLALVEQLGAEAVLVDRDGTMHPTSGMHRFVVPTSTRVRVA